MGSQNGEIREGYLSGLGSELESFKAGPQDGKPVGTGHISWHRPFGWVGTAWQPEVDLMSKLQVLIINTNKIKKLIYKNAS